MPSAFDTDFAAADALLAEVFGGQVGIRRKGSETTLVTAEVILRDYEVIDEATGLPQLVQSRDYLIAATDYKVGGSQVDPRGGDRLTETVNGSDLECEAMTIGKRPAAEWYDAGRTRWVIHTKLVKECPTPS